MVPSSSDLDLTCAHVEPDVAPRPYRITGPELVIGSILGGAAGTFIVCVLFGLIG